MFIHFLKIFRTKAVSCQKSFLRMKPVSLVRKPGKASKMKKHPAKGLSVLATVRTESSEIVDGPQAHLLHSIVSFWVESIMSYSSENSPSCSHSVKGTTALWAPPTLHYTPRVPKPGHGYEKLRVTEDRIPSRDEEAVPPRVTDSVHQPWRMVLEIESVQGRGRCKRAC